MLNEQVFRQLARLKSLASVENLKNQPMDTSCNKRVPLKSLLAYCYLFRFFTCM